MENSKKVTSEEKLIALLKKISAKGHNAEVKQEKNVYVKVRLLNDL